MMVDMNRLGTATSTYLLQHKDNPVDWWPWGAAPFAEAARRDVPVLLSSREQVELLGSGRWGPLRRLVAQGRHRGRRILDRAPDQGRAASPHPGHLPSRCGARRTRELPSADDD
jgi:hypothetical protein